MATDEQPRDRHIRRSGDDYTYAFMTLLPKGQAWPKEPDSTLFNACDGLSQYWGWVDGRAADLLERESDPRKATDITLGINSWYNSTSYRIGDIVYDPVDSSQWECTGYHTSPATGLMKDFRDTNPEMWKSTIYPGIRDGLLPDWEKAWGLPDPCFPTATTIAERQRMLVLYMTWMGGQSRDYYIKLMEFLGYKVNYVGEFAPFMAGISQVGDTRPSITVDGVTFPDEHKNFRWYIGPPEMRFSWFINVGQATLTWFRAASGQAGVDPHLKIGIPQDLQCLLNRWKPAHTFLAMDFSGLAFGSPMAGTP
jgi:uncharacterized protein YmfQ (DUF2313 family)